MPWPSASRDTRLRRGSSPASLISCCGFHLDQHMLVKEGGQGILRERLHVRRVVGLLDGGLNHAVIVWGVIPRRKCRSHNEIALDLERAPGLLLVHQLLVKLLARLRADHADL